MDLRFQSAHGLGGGRECATAMVALYTANLRVAGWQSCVETPASTLVTGFLGGGAAELHDDGRLYPSSGEVTFRDAVDFRY